MSSHFVKSLVAGECYHIYNRGNNSEQIFYKPENYRYFLRKYDKYFSDCLDTFAYNLLNNHFHFAVKVKEKSELITLDDFIKM